jgi:2-furoyl-CoA dehydrogenase FAD binding subunit
MKPARFDYVRVDTLDEAADILAQSGDDARVLAGGQSLMAMMNLRLAQPAVVVDILHATGPRSPEVARDRLRISALVRQEALSTRASLAHEVPLLAQAAPWIGHIQTRMRGTVCGSVAHADPSAELPLVLVALDGRVHLKSRRKRRTVPAREFFLGMMVTEKSDDELIEAVDVPLTPPGTGTAFREVGRRKGDFAIVSCATVVRGSLTRLAVGGVNDTPVVADWENLAPADVAEALNAFAWSLDTRDDMHASARYRRDLVRRLGETTIREARSCAD